MKNDIFELQKVGLTGTFGTLAAMTLADVATLTSIAVGVATFLYVATKLFYLIRSGGRDAK